MKFAFFTTITVLASLAAASPIAGPVSSDKLLQRSANVQIDLTARERFAAILDLLGVRAPASNAEERQMYMDLIGLDFDALDAEETDSDSDSKTPTSENVSLESEGTEPQLMVYDTEPGHTDWVEWVEDENPARRAKSVNDDKELEADWAEEWATVADVTAVDDDWVYERVNSMPAPGGYGDEFEEEFSLADTALPFAALFGTIEPLLNALHDRRVYAAVMLAVATINLITIILALRFLGSSRSRSGSGSARCCRCECHCDVESQPLPVIVVSSADEKR